MSSKTSSLNGGGYGGSLLRAHFAPGWAPFTRSFPDPRLSDTNSASFWDTYLLNLRSGIGNLPDSDSTGSLLGGSQLGRLDTTPAPTAQAKYSQAGAITHGSTAPVHKGGAPATPPPTTNLPTPATTTPAAASALASAVAQSLGDGVRPMTVAPPRTVARIPSPHRISDASPESSGGGPPPPNAPPVLSFSGGNTQLIKAGAYNVPTPIPIGKIADIIATSPMPNDPGYTITSYSWSGGTEFSSYVSTPSGKAPPASQKLGQNVLANQPTYQFIITADAQAYTITLNVTYQNNATGESTLDFNSDTPPGSLGVVALGNVTTSTSATQVTVGISTSVPLVIQFTASTDTYTAGQFMLMQIVNSSYGQYTDATGQSWYLTNGPAFPGFSGPLHDDSSSFLSLGYPVVYGPAPPLEPQIIYYSLNTPANTSIPGPLYVPPWTADNPGLSVGLTNETVTRSGTFSDYLM